MSEKELKQLLQQYNNINKNDIGIGKVVGYIFVALFILWLLIALVWSAQLLIGLF